MSALERDGLISRHRGRGTFVRPAGALVSAKTRITHPLLGYEADVRLVKAESVPAPADVVSFLKVARGERIKRFVRVETVDDMPLAVVLNYVTPDLGRRIPARALRRHSMLEFLRDRLGIRFGNMRQIVAARLPDDELASLLGITLTQPILHLRLLVPDTADRPIEISDTFYRADRYRYELDAVGLRHARGETRRSSAPVRERRSGAAGS